MYSQLPTPPQGRPAKKDDLALRKKKLEARRLENKLDKQRRGRASPKGRTPLPFATLRLRELERLFSRRYGDQLAHDDAGLDDLFVGLNHLASGDDAEYQMTCWSRRWASWLCDDDRDDLIKRICEKPLRWTADSLAHRVGLDDKTRTELQIRTIGATDCNKEAREARRKQRHVERQRARRRAAGSISRAQYESSSAARTRPWQKLGMSERTWRRKGKPALDAPPTADLAEVRAQSLLHNNSTSMSTDSGHVESVATAKPSPRDVRAPRLSARAVKTPSPPITPTPFGKGVTGRYPRSQRSAVTPARAPVETLMSQALSLTQQPNTALPTSHHNSLQMKGAPMTSNDPIETLLADALSAAAQRRRDSIMRDQYITALTLHPDWQRTDRGYSSDDDASPLSPEAMVSWLQINHPSKARQIEREHAS